MSEISDINIGTKKIKVPVIPHQQIFIGSEETLDYKSICVFAACGFFLDNSTYFNELKTLKPATEYQLSKNDEIISAKRYWEWYYNPRNISLDNAVEEFAEIFESIVKRDTAGKKIILPISGGLDSRTLAAVTGKNTHAYAYMFKNSFAETKYGKKIAAEKNIPFNQYIIPEGYIWNKLDHISNLNKCYSDFTTPRQIAVLEEVSQLGDVFLLGHMGDAAFDSTGFNNISFEEQVNYLKKKIVKRGGLELANALWAAWGINGSFEDYLTGIIEENLQKIKIENPDARIRAFKSTHWVARWTSVGLGFFSHYKEISLPYYDQKMCDFICSVPEKLLAGRQIQIEYLKRYHPELAKITWQSKDPYNLFNFESPPVLLRAKKQIQRAVRLKNRLIGRRLITRNWENQFLGEENDKQLRKHLFENKNFAEFIPENLVKNFYDGFKMKDDVYYSHSINMLLVLSKFSEVNSSKISGK